MVRVLDGELLYTKILEVNLFAFAYTDCFMKISVQSTGRCMVLILFSGFILYLHKAGKRMSTMQRPVDWWEIFMNANKLTSRIFLHIYSSYKYSTSHTFSNSKSWFLCNNVNQIIKAPQHQAFLRWWFWMCWEQFKCHLYTEIRMSWVWSRVEKKFGLDHTWPLGRKNATRGPLEFPSIYTKIRCSVRYE